MQLPATHHLVGATLFAASSLAVSSADATVLAQLDLGPTEVQTDFTQWSHNDATNPTSDHNNIPDNVIGVGPVGIDDVTVGGITFSFGTGATDVRDRDDISGGPFVGLSDLLGDAWQQTGSNGTTYWSIEISGLAAGLHTWTGYHHDGNVTTPREMMQIEVDGVLEFTGAASVGTSPAAITTSVIDFTSDGVNPVVFEFIGLDDVSGTSQIYLNGFEISVIPEPGSLALAGAGGLLMLARRRRDR